MDKPNWQPLTEAYLETVEDLRTLSPGAQLPMWPHWNDILGGLQERQYTILCGPTGSGKTTFLANVSAQLILAGVQQFVMSVETGRHDYITRVMCALDGQNLRRVEPVPESLLAGWHARHGEKFSRDTMHVSVYESRCKVGQLINDIRWQVANWGCKFVVIDNLNFFMEPGGANEMILEMDRVTHSLIEFVKQVPVHIVMVMHPKKTDGGELKSEFDIKGSSTAVQEAHNVLLFNRPTAENIKNGAKRSDREINFIKLRKRGQNQGCRLYFEVKDSVYYNETKLWRP